MWHFVKLIVLHHQIDRIMRNMSSSVVGETHQILSLSIQHSTSPSNRKDVQKLHHVCINYFKKIIVKYLEYFYTVSLLIHGWLETPATTWIMPMVTNILKASNGCVCSVDYSAYSCNADYFNMVNVDYLPLANITLKKAQQIGNFSRMHMFGFSFGGRIATKVGSDLNSQVQKVQLCESAGPGFQYSGIADRDIPPTKAGKEVSCINTSSGYGTTVYDCHQNWRMGYCG